jgi:hypothetical protein
MDELSLESNIGEFGYFPEVFGSLKYCPHCNSARPSLSRKFSLESPIQSELIGLPLHWAVYACTTCGLPISALYKDNNYLGDNRHRHNYRIFPSKWQPDEAIPDVPKKYLTQANATLGSPDASVVMSASAIDAMLKVKGLSEGSLYERIHQAVEKGILTNDMSKWAHLVRLNSNNPRHADIEKPNMSIGDARLSLDFAKALGEILFVLPSRMPEEQAG